MKETEVTELGIDVPDWIEQDITNLQVQSIVQGGCDSGATCQQLPIIKRSKQ